MVEGHKRGLWLKIGACTLALVLFFCVLTLNFAFPLRFNDIINANSSENDLDPTLIYALIWTESKFNPNAISPKGARGLMQLMPSTAQFCAQSLGEEFNESKLFDPSYNIKLGTFYLKYLFNKYGENAIYAYNAGEGNLNNWLKNGGKIEFKETRDYYKRIKIAQKIYALKT